MDCKWGILGPGFIATRAIIPAIQALSSSCTLAIASSNEQRAREVAFRFDVERYYSDYQALLDDPDIDVVYIALPNHLHHKWTIRAAQAGKHVLCEKPLAMSADECSEMIAACHQAQVLLMEAVMYRFHPRMRYLKQMLLTHEIGDVRFVHAAFSFNFNAPDNYRAYKQFGGGSLLDVGSYCVNAARWLIGSEPVSSQAVSSYDQNSIDLNTSAILSFSDDVSAHIQSSFVAAEHQVIEVVGTIGAVTAPLAFTAWQNDATVLLIQRGTAFEQKEFAPSDPYQLMVEHFARCVMETTPLLFPAEDAWANLRALDMLRRVENP
ncbi:MAG TPA: Gfo/Idh/MocA family oxidoreductase, partial [Ktedonobacteraceae bacterium]|nr:Gfo/Idh/MocA family oxidoreductase [Ktedonobacteraceae bacterium]